MSAGIVGSELLVNLAEANDVATLQVEGSSYTVRSGTQTLGSFSAAAVNAIRVTGDLAQPHQSLVIKPGGVLADPLTVDAGVDATVVGAAIVTTGSVRIDSATLTLAQDVRTSGDQTYAGLVRLANDIVLDAGSGRIQIGGEIRSTVGPRATIMEDIGAPYRLAVSPNGQTLYATDAVSNFVYFIDLAAEQLDTVDLGNGKSVGNVALSPNGSRLYVANTYDNAVTVLDTATRGILATIGVTGTPEGMAFSADGTTLYVANYSENSVAVINTVTNQLVRTIAVQGNPTAVAAAPDGRLWVTSETRNRVSVVHPTMGTILAEIVVGRGPADIALSPDGTRAYVANNFGNTVSVIDTASAAVIATLVAGNGPTELAVAADGRLVYVVNGFSDDISVIDAGSLSVATTVPVGSLPVGITLAADGKTAYVANLNSLSELGNDSRSLTVRTTGIAKLDAPASTVDPLRALVVEAIRELEAAGAVALTVDTVGNLRANGQVVTFNGAPFRHTTDPNAAWRAVAADVDQGVNTIVLKHSSGFLHFWRMDASWRQVSGDGWVAPGSAGFYATELAFDADLDGDGRVMIEAAGGVALSYDGSGNLRVNDAVVIFNGGPINYHGMVAAGWTAMAAEADQGVQTVVLKHSSGNLHFWRMDADWKQVSGDGWVAPGSTAFFVAEVTYGVDLDGDGVLTIETDGDVIFAYDADGNITANGTPVIFNGGPMSYYGMVVAGWRARAADIDRGVNTVVLEHASGFLHFWRMDTDWKQVSGDGWVAPGSQQFSAAEAAFGADLDGDGIRTVEAAGSVILTYDRVGNMRANGTSFIFNGGPFNYYGAVAAGWLIAAADVSGGQNTVVLRHAASGFLHFWRMEVGTWNQATADGWVAPGSADFFATELAFGVDIDRNGAIGS